MEKYNESNIKKVALDRLIRLVKKNNNHLGDRIELHREQVSQIVIQNIQKIGTQQYALRLTTPNTDEAKDLKALMNKWNP